MSLYTHKYNSRVPAELAFLSSRLDLVADLASRAGGGPVQAEI
jgi:hypothetical protein